MSDSMAKSANDSSSFRNANLQSVTRPKFQPVRLKALLQFCESDDDDDDDDKENENKIHVPDDNSDDELHPHENHPVFQDDSFKNMSKKLSSTASKADINSNSKTMNEESSRTIHTSLKEDCKLTTNGSFVQEKVICAVGKEEHKISDIDPESHFLNGESNKLKTYSCKREEKTQECNDNMVLSKSHPVNTVTHERSINASLSSSSLSAYKGDHNAKSDGNRSLQMMNSIQLHHDSVHMPDILRRKEEHTYSTSVENRKLLGQSSENYLLNLNKEDKRHKGAQCYTEQGSKECEEKYRSLRVSNSGFVESTCVTTSQTISSNLMHLATKYSTTQHSNIVTPSTSDKGKMYSTINRLAMETPLKHASMAPTHPNPCMSHKQLFTPQSKLLSDLDLKSHIETPSTLLSSTKCLSKAGHTSMEGKNFVAMERTQTPRNNVYTPVIGKGDTRYFGMDAKSMRRPLADAISLTHGDSLAYTLESKPLLLQKRSEVKCIASDSQQEDKDRKIGRSEMKLTHTEANYDNDLKSSNPVEETEKNKQPYLLDALLENSKKTVYDKKEVKQMAIDSSTGVINNSARKYNSEENIASNPTEYKDSHDHHMMDHRIDEKLCEKEWQVATDQKVTNVQFSVPSSIPQQRQNKTLCVKGKEYLILGSLGQGMCGEVLRVQDMSCGELRAIKCVNLSKLDKDSAQGCLDEISLLRKLQAPCVIKMFDYYIKDSMIYVIMEMGDTDLSRLLKSMSLEKKIPLTMVLYYWTEMLTAVKHIHDNGVIHSDLKPANFLLVRGRLKLIDFGIASNINSDMTSVLKNNPIGTLNYISPEALMDIGEGADSPNHNVKYKISFKSDVWSLGCILYSLVYGHTPFQHIRPQWAKINAITNPKLNISFPAITNGSEDSQSSGSSILIDVIRKCLQHDPKARPTVSQLLQMQYVPTTQNVTPISKHNIPPNILVKIKRILNEEEWRQLIQILDAQRHHT